MERKSRGDKNEDGEKAKAPRSGDKKLELDESGAPRSSSRSKRSRPSSSSTWRERLALVFGLAMVPFAFYFRIPEKLPLLLLMLQGFLFSVISVINSDPMEIGIGGLAALPVARLLWNPNVPFANMIANLGQPVILSDTAVSQWAARTKWTPEFLAENAPELNGVQRHNDSTFYYFHSNRPMAGLNFSLFYKSATYQRVNMSSRSFFDTILAESAAENRPPQFHYYAADAESLGKLYNDLDPLEPLMVRNASWRPEISHKFRWTNVWFGPKGATTHTHYDISHNFYVQIYGRKRFTLYAPEDVHSLYPFPVLHPGAQQSQVRFTEGQWPVPRDAALFPDFVAARSIEAILEPGDVLYVPPLWFHHVTALNTSLSVSVWSPSKETQVMHEAERTMILPWKTSWSLERKALACRIFLEAFLIALEGGNQMLPFARQLVDQRYRPLIAQQPEFLQRDDSASFCKSALEIEGGGGLSEAKLLEELGQVMEDTIAQQVPLYSQLSSKARRDIWLGNAVEQAAMSAVGVHQVAAFLLDFVSC